MGEVKNGESQMKATMEVMKKYRAELAKREEMEDRLLQQSKSVNTVEDLMVLFPKLKKHIPQPVIDKKSLPVAQKDLMDELVKMGLEV